MKPKAYVLLGVFMLVAGANHFVMPEFYLPLIPGYLPFPKTINAISGVLELLIGAGFLWPATRSMAGFGMLVLMVAFIPAHVHFIVIGSCIADGLCVPAWVGWFRLLAIHPILMWLAWRVWQKAY
jgi:uncharacterized membrane protein